MEVKKDFYEQFWEQHEKAINQTKQKSNPKSLLEKLRIIYFQPQQQQLNKEIKEENHFSQINFKPEEDDSNLLQQPEPIEKDSDEDKLF